jgi:hypothetical protein
MGKLAHCLPTVAQPRLPGSAKPVPEALESIQIAINNVTRSVVGCRREDRITVKDLLDSAKYLSLIQLVVKSLAMAAWSWYESNDGEAGTRNPVGRLMVNSNLVASWPTRATAAGEVRVPTRGVKTLVRHALEIWNSCAELMPQRRPRRSVRPLPWQRTHRCEAVRRVLFSLIRRKEGMTTLRRGWEAKTGETRKNICKCEC